MGKSSKKRCVCGNVERVKYPEGIQKEDLLWSYFVMRMICEVMGDPELLKRIQDRNKSGPATMFDLAMMCCATKNAGAFQNAAAAANAQNAPPPQPGTQQPPQAGASPTGASAQGAGAAGVGGGAGAAPPAATGAAPGTPAAGQPGATARR